MKENSNFHPSFPEASLGIRNFHHPRRPLTMGIVNINDDSFCQDGTVDPAKAMAKALALVEEGADIIDAGAESARTNRRAISVAEEVDRFGPFLAEFHRQVRNRFATPPVEGQCWPPAVSLNTWRTEVVRSILPLGGDLLNDIGGLPDDSNAALCARHGVSLLIMHTQGTPKVAHTHVTYREVVAEVASFFEEKIQLALRSGMSPAHLVLDPGIDFAKQKDDNLRLYRDLKYLVDRFPQPMLLPVSRKTVIGEVLGISDPNLRDAGTVACIARGLAAGASIFRVHNVKATVDVLRVLQELGGSPEARVMISANDTSAKEPRRRTDPENTK
ncbi:MAG TPA: dihydropteroate synthase [Verrucomicrobiales bacterium]|nr:dihydropteroate synthase [Verrucomicrobiales bacterium]